MRQKHVEESEEDSVSAESAESEQFAEEADTPEDTATVKKPTTPQAIDAPPQASDTEEGYGDDDDFDAEDETKEEADNISDGEVDDGVDDEIGDDVIESDQDMRVEEVGNLTSRAALVAPDEDIHSLTHVHRGMCWSCQLISSPLAGHIGGRW